MIDELDGSLADVAHQSFLLMRGDSFHQEVYRGRPEFDETGRETRATIY
jgi:hypothetical protein